MRIGEAAKQVGLPVKTVRYYSDIGLVSPGSRTEARYRRYDDEAIEKLKFVKRARAFGFSIDECRDLLGLQADPNRSSADVRAIASDRLDEIKAKQRELELLYRELSTLVAACCGDDQPDCPIIDHLS